MRDFIKTKYFASGICLIILSFSVGTFVGFNHRPEIEKIIGISNKEVPADMTNVDFSGHPFDRLAIKSLTPGNKLVVELRGVPEGRSGLWITAAIVAALMFGLAFAGIKLRT